MKILLKILPLILVLAIAFVTILIANQGETKVTADYIGQNSPDTTNEVSPSHMTSTPSVSPSEEPPPYDGPVNPLTGQPAHESIVGNRPYAIMINNISSAQPQLGVSKADIIFEIVVEGGITRMMAFFQDVTDVGEIGSIRSARPYFVRIAFGYNAIYIHAGGSNDAYIVMKSTGITRLDGVHGSKQDIFFRDAERRSKLGYEHSLVTTGQLMNDYIPGYGIKMELSNEFDNGLSFKPDGTPDTGASAEHIKVHFSASKTTTFDYSDEDKLYYASQYGLAYKDGDDGTQIAITNLLVLRTDVAVIAGDTAGRMDVAVTGSGEGLFFCGGSYEPIRWSRSDSSKPFTFTRTDGSELIFGIGKSYISIIPNSSSVDIS